MTRINLIPPRLLMDKHLLAEHREIKRIPNHLEVHGIGCSTRGPRQYTLGTGHVLFFIKYGKWLFDRYEEIRKECLLRCFDVSNYGTAWNVYLQFSKRSLFNDWDYVTNDNIQTSVNRILERLPKDMRMNKKIISLSDYKLMLKQSYPWIKEQGGVLHE